VLTAMNKYTPSLHTRREFLRRGLGLAAASLTVPAWLHRSVIAADSTGAPALANGSDRILVVIQLSGGNDGLNTVVPFANDDYHKARPALRLKPDELIKVDDELGLHPRLAPFKKLLDDGHAAILQGVGYPNPDRSHFRALEIWHTASDSDKFERTGWIGRYFDNECQGFGSPAVGVAIGGQTPQAFTNTSSLGITLARPDAFKWRQTLSGDGPLAQAEMCAYHAMHKSLQDDADFLTRTALNAQIASERVRTAASRASSKADYPNSPLGADLKNIAAMISGGLGSRIYYANFGGFDTHSGQTQRHPGLLSIFASAVAAFHSDLKAQGLDQRVLVMCFSEFGRRVKENASGGTDHGVAGPMFLVGGALKPGIHGAHPSLTDLTAGDLKSHTDFRRVYATVLEDWLGAKSEPILGRKFEKLPLV
jgi:uncharacterized protein (DUF1501 family)